MASIPIYKDNKEDRDARNVRVVLSPISSNKFPNKRIKTCTVSSSKAEGQPQECIELSHKELFSELSIEFNAKLEEQKKQVEENRKEQEVKNNHLQGQIDHLDRQLGVLRRDIMPQCPMCKNKNKHELEVLYCGHVLCGQCIADLKCNDCPFCDVRNPNRFVHNPDTNSPCKPLYP